MKDGQQRIKTILLKLTVFLTEKPSAVRYSSLTL